MPLQEVSLELSQKPHDIGLKIKMLKRNSFCGMLGFSIVGYVRRLYLAVARANLLFKKFPLWDEKVTVRQIKYCHFGDLVPAEPKEICTNSQRLQR